MASAAKKSVEFASTLAKRFDLPGAERVSLGSFGAGGGLGRQMAMIEQQATQGLEPMTRTNQNLILGPERRAARARERGREKARRSNTPTRQEKLFELKLMKGLRDMDVDRLTKGSNMPGDTVADLHRNQDKAKAYFAGKGGVKSNLPADQASRNQKGGIMKAALGKGAGFLATNAGIGAAMGALTGGFNPAGNDGFLAGAVKGAAIGGIAGAVAGSAFADDAAEMLTKGGTGVRLNKGRVSLQKGGEAFSFTPRLAGVAGGAAGFMGGSGKRNTTINSNGWTKGTHPMYFGG